MKILITAPSLDTKINVSGVSSVTNFIIDNCKDFEYHHFELGKKDAEKRGIFWGLRILGAWFKWSWFMLFKHYDMIHFNYALSKPSIIRDTPLVFFSRLCRKKMILHFHGGDFLMNDEIPSWIVFVLKLVCSGRQPKVVLIPLEKVRIEEKFNAKNVYVLANCVELEEAKAFHRIKKDTGPLNVLFLGRIVKSKGLEDIYQALKLVKGEFMFNLFMAGKGNLEQEYVQKFSSVLGDHFQFLGIVSGKDKIDLIKKSDVFLLPSLFGEGLPMALLECMSFGVVPVTTDDGSMKYVIEHMHNGIMVNKNSPLEIENALETLIKDRDLLFNLSANTKHYIFDHYNPENYVRELEKIYSES